MALSTKVVSIWGGDAGSTAADPLGDLRDLLWVIVDDCPDASPDGTLADYHVRPRAPRHVYDRIPAQFD